MVEGGSVWTTGPPGTSLHIVPWLPPLSFLPGKSWGSHSTMLPKGWMLERVTEVRSSLGFSYFFARCMALGTLFL